MDSGNSIPTSFSPFLLAEIMYLEKRPTQKLSSEETYGKFHFSMNQHHGSDACGSYFSISARRNWNGMRTCLGDRNVRIQMHKSEFLSIEQRDDIMNVPEGARIDPLITALSRGINARNFQRFLTMLEENQCESLAEDLRVQGTLPIALKISTDMNRSFCYAIMMQQLRFISGEIFRAIDRVY
ncbi:unnamed protein product [Darwinula stevensoni]|uniref:Uncharacterized protein n=1 Tax=Darwinula stevensoni TaxID=69355 RepID=A0A7R8XDS6_9CRUS|nr:unnamed protein product [Darwinula stevensoni]CAG0893359.1 unnamed protein product [Darwinula stevensoni]